MIDPTSPFGAATPSDVDVPTATLRRQLKPGDLVDRVVARSGAKKRDAKGIVEATLAELGEALSKGEELNLKPMGKMVVKREKRVEDRHVLNLKLVRKEGPPQGASGLADDDGDV